MSAKLLDGKPIAAGINEQLKQEIEALKLKYYSAPHLAAYRLALMSHQRFMLNHRLMLRLNLA